MSISPPESPLLFNLSQDRPIIMWSVCVILVLICVVSVITLMWRVPDLSSPLICWRFGLNWWDAVTLCQRKHAHMQTKHKDIHLFVSSAGTEAPHGHLSETRCSRKITSSFFISFFSITKYIGKNNDCAQTGFQHGF